MGVEMRLHKTLELDIFHAHKGAILYTVELMISRAVHMTTCAHAHTWAHKPTDVPRQPRTDKNTRVLNCAVADARKHT